MNTRELQEAILQLKKEKDVCILAHAYQSHNITEIADYVGDSYGLSVEASKMPHQTILMCGVRFMAETVKILSPKKRVLLSHSEAGCPMAEQLTVESIRSLKAQYPDYAVCAYVNTTAELKAECDVCVTSASAPQIVKRIDNDKILFLPDCNLGSYIETKVPEKTIQCINGGCPAHGSISNEELQQAKAAHPNALLLVHPECKKEIWEQADYVGSTTGIMSYVAKSDASEFIIGTENSIIEHLQFEHPDKYFYALSKHLVCSDMKLTTLVEVYNCLNGTGGEEILLSDDVITRAKKSLDAMIELGG